MKSRTILYFLAGLVLLATNGTVVAQWVQTSLDTVSVNTIAVSGTNIFASTGWPFISLPNGVFRSTDNGTTWTAVNNGLPEPLWVSVLVVSDTHLFAGTGSGVFRSTNNGTSWTEVNTGLTDSVVLSLTVSGIYLFAGTNSDVFRSSNNGTTWTAADSGLPVNIAAVNAFAVSGPNIFLGAGNPFGGGDAGVFLSTNSGTSWTEVKAGLTNTNVMSLAVSGEKLFAGTYPSGVFLSTNNGASWAPANTPFSEFSEMLRVGPNLFAGTGSPYSPGGDGVFLSTNGTTWTTVNAGLTDTSVHALAVADTNLFAGTQTGVWRHPLSEMITSVERLSYELPAHFILDQNYPNPFNPSTNIKFQVPNANHVTLKVYDVLGREVRTLVNENLQAGSYEVTFSAEGGSASGGDATGLASGVYLYRLDAGTFVETKNLILMR